MYSPTKANLESRPGRSTIWVHAEAYGFGPSSLLLTLAPMLRKLASSIGPHTTTEYVGQGHTLDLNTAPPWDNVHNCDISTTQGKQALGDLFHLQQPVLIVVACDAAFVELLSRFGARRLVVIDPLMWYWPSVPLAWANASLVIAVDYIGVRARVDEAKLHNAVVVPPLVPSIGRSISKGPRKGTLVNLGGLRNPHASADENIAFASLVLSVVEQAIQSRNCPDDLPLHFLTSQEVCAGMQSDVATSTSPEKARVLLSQCKTAFLTSGLSNIYDAADCGGRVVFLPATSKSQGEQPELMERDLGCTFTRIDWHELNITKPKMEYSQTSYTECSPLIQSHQKALMEDRVAQERYVKRVLECYEAEEDNAKELQILFSCFGRDDGTLIMKAIVDAIAREPDARIRVPSRLQNSPQPSI
ncbi:unnamed protein product [Clonostachys byssicola]|uniref:Uncharacterized protein n=1 Tax=Clonostachys byssicola TaxID=160290 RepID=A0A9N9U9S0_9HYPO|nr:unnamed protein product [Clonostachys byssicola]